jgi:hypothetical protein
MYVPMNTNGIGCLGKIAVKHELCEGIVGNKCRKKVLRHCFKTLYLAPKKGSRST